MTFRFPTKRKQRQELPFSGLFDLRKSEKEIPGNINGIPARSLEEWRVAKALWKYKVDFRYQHSLFGGIHRRGGVVLDFLIIDAMPYALEVQGERWHKGQFGSGDHRREAIIEAYLGTKVRYVWGNDLQTQEAADAAVRKVI